MNPTARVPSVSPEAHRAVVLARFADAVWLKLTSLPSLEMLAGAHFADIADVINAFDPLRLIAVGDAASGARRVRFPGPGGFEGFQVELAGKIVCRLEGRLGRANNLDLIACILPAALAGILVRDARPGASPADEDYSLVGTSARAV